jgi:hypothetical protein
VGTEYEAIRDRVITRQGDALRAWRESQKRPRIPPVLDEGQDMVRVTGEVQPVPRYTPPGADRVLFRRKSRARRSPRLWCSVCLVYPGRTGCEHYPRKEGS